jgi:hypothetical protein
MKLLKICKLDVVAQAMLMDHHILSNYERVVGLGVVVERPGSEYVPDDSFLVQQGESSGPNSAQAFYYSIS